MSRRMLALGGTRDLLEPPLPLPHVQQEHPVHEKSLRGTINKSKTKTNTVLLNQTLMVFLSRHACKFTGSTL